MKFKFVSILFICNCLWSCKQINAVENYDSVERINDRQLMLTILLTLNDITRREHINSLANNNYTFRFSVVDRNRKKITESEYCVNIYIPTIFATEKVITEWQTYEKNADKCPMQGKVFYRCQISEILYVNELILSGDFTDLKKKCEQEGKGIFFVF